MASGDSHDVGVEEVAEGMKKVSVKDYLDENGVKGKMVIKQEVKDGVLHLNFNAIDCSPREFESGKDGDRHCAFCLDLVPKKVMLCGKCNRRAYCSKECQIADWKTPSKDAPAFNEKIYGYGQGHKNWCGLEYGEEDLDWKVTPISGKGLGIVALRDLPPLYRIIVDGAQRFPKKPAPFRIHPAFHDLTMATSDDPFDLITKWKENAVGVSSVKQRPMDPLGLRIARVNHSCDPNTGVYPSDEYNVLILSSDKEIKAGEEICWAYSSVLDLNLFGDIKDSTPPLMLAKRILEKEWGIVCPSTCICRGEKEVIYSSLIHTCLALQKEGEARFKMPTKGRPALPKMEAIIEIYQSVGAPESVMINLFSTAANYAISDVNNGITSNEKQNYEKAKKYREKYYNIISRVLHPKDNDVVRCREALEYMKKYKLM